MAMFAILISELTEQQPPKLESPMHLFSRKSFHSGSWRCPFDLSSLGASTWVLGRVAPAKHPGRQWRAVLLHMDGFVVSTPVAPSCRTLASPLMCGVYLPVRT